MWKPLNNTVLIRKDAVKETTDTGIVLPNVQEGSTVSGEVVAAADTFLEDKKVLFSKYSGSEVEVKGEKLFLVRQEDVLAYWQDQ